MPHIKASWFTNRRQSPSSCFIVLFLLYILKEGYCKPADNVSSKLDVWDPNYCNDTKMQESAGLSKTALGQFLGYSCDATFFHCRWSVDGWKTYKKTCRKGLVYDRIGTQNCNYEFNVEGCGSKQCADCLDDQYACCLSEECVELGQRCDGKYDCTLEEDEQNCPTCGATEYPCVLSEQCIPMEKRCNGIKECKDGTDELHCDDCPASMFYCRSTKKCIEKESRCDGKRDCNYGEDEAFCTSTVQKDYVCEDQQHSISIKDICNGFPDCPDGSDEQYCAGGVPMEYHESSKVSRSNGSAINIEIRSQLPVQLPKSTEYVAPTFSMVTAKPTKATTTRVPATSLHTLPLPKSTPMPPTLSTRKVTAKRSATRNVTSPPLTTTTTIRRTTPTEAVEMAVAPSGPDNGHRNNDTRNEEYFYEP